MRQLDRQKEHLTMGGVLYLANSVNLRGGKHLLILLHVPRCVAVVVLLLVLQTRSYAR